MWLNKVPRLHYPQLFSFAKNASPSLHLVMNAGELEDFLHLPLSPLAVTQLLQVAEDFLTLPASDEKDTWTYIWGSSFFSTSRAYKHLTGHMPIHPFFRKIWKSCQNKHKFFFWLLLRNRLSTREILRRRNMHMPSYACVCCNLDTEESLTHLFFRCPFAQSCWISLNIVLVESNTTYGFGGNQRSA